MAEENRALREDMRSLHGPLVGESVAMRAVRDLVERAAAVDSTVLVTGESGTGKELVARSIHDLSRRRERPFMAVNCAAMAGDLFESSLFGHERGAFTGADRRHIGRIESAGKGTFFLDEVGEIPLHTQAKLLRVLQERRFERLGSRGEILMEARLVASTNRDLEQAMAQGEFRNDLFYRLNVLRIRTPPLRERREDLSSLVPYLLKKRALEMKIPVPGISGPALQMLQGWHWPGNVRELENVLQGALVYSKGGDLEPDDFPCLQQNRVLAADFGTARKMTVEYFERQYIRSVLRSAGGNISEAARRMNVSRYGLQKMMKRLGMNDGEDQGE